MREDTRQAKRVLRLQHTTHHTPHTTHHTPHNIIVVVVVEVRNVLLQQLLMPLKLLSLILAVQVPGGMLEWSCCSAVLQAHFESTQTKSAGGQAAKRAGEKVEGYQIHGAQVLFMDDVAAKTIFSVVLPPPLLRSRVLLVGTFVALCVRGGQLGSQWASRE